MSGLGISPSVMVNRIVLREGDTSTPHLAKVAKLRADLMAAADAEQAKAALLSPTGQAEPVLIDSGAVVDRLV
ncbi:hypothetical protein JI749_04470 [Devosia oryziradicis]|uniref:Uncharacterized protein n=1 Tax=Devosia oryziradicis TaxID=2801335 RepID=A0ABX7BY57_9HYPH|nr:hypothetical protein [Devosia oryziradicis]QQR36892.1 hypothetical protein JI749_04470 [Devosia oryziradicis]